VIFYDVDDLIERRGRLEAVVAESAGHLAAHLGVLRHGEDEMWLASGAVWLIIEGLFTFSTRPPSRLRSIWRSSATMKRANASGPPLSVSKPWLLRAV